MAKKKAVSKDLKDSPKGKKTMPFAPEVLDQLLEGCQTPEQMFGADGLLQQLTKALLERSLQAELTHHLGYEKHDPAGHNSGNSRNGTSSKTIKGKRGQMQIEVPRDRNAQFEPQLIQKGQTRFDGFDERVLSLYARGLSVREIQAHIEEIYGTQVSPDLISTVTEAVLEEVKAWQARPLDALYPIVYLDALQVKIRSEGRVTNKSIYLAIGINLRGHKEVLGLWAAQNEGAKFWLGVMTELKNRGVQDIFIACVDGLKGFPEAIEAVFPQTQVQLCLVHLVRYSLAFVSFKHRKEVAADLKTIYQSATAQEAQAQLEAFAYKWDDLYPLIAKSWRNNWLRLVPMFGYPPEIRRAIYTTNAIESLNMSLRKVIKTRASFPNEEAAFKLLYLALQNIQKKWTMPIPNWGQAMNAFFILFEERMPTNLDNSFTQTF
jgi:putative transposase